MNDINDFKQVWIENNSDDLLDNLLDNLFARINECGDLFGKLIELIRPEQDMIVEREILSEEYDTLLKYNEKEIKFLILQLIKHLASVDYMYKKCMLIGTRSCNIEQCNYNIQVLSRMTDWINSAFKPIRWMHDNIPGGPEREEIQRLYTTYIESVKKVFNFARNRSDWNDPPSNIKDIWGNKI